MLKNLSKTLKSSTQISHIHTKNKPIISNPAIDFVLSECENLEPSNPVKNASKPAPKTQEQVETKQSCVEISNKWPEWVGLMDKLKKYGYFDGAGIEGVVEGKRCNWIRTGCLNFARHRPSLMRYFTGTDIQTVAGCGCPSTDRKVVNSGKRLRAHMGIDEGNVCSSCLLRGNCERAYVKAREDEGGRTVDVMRFVVTYGLAHVTGTEGNEQMINKRVEEAIKNLIKAMVKYSKDEVEFDSSKRVPLVSKGQTQQQEHRSTIPIIQGDWNCPKCKLLNSAKNVKCMGCNELYCEGLDRTRYNRDDIQLKKGDWVCLRCNFLNFAKNTRCLQCQTNPPKRQLNSGEWACDSCNYINFKRNMACLKCDHKRPKAFNNG